METSHPLENVISSGKNIDNQSSDILQHSQNRPTGDRCIRLKNMTIQILRKKIQQIHVVGNFFLISELIIQAMYNYKS